jgi:transcriptional regulator with XRE-family HTH domain
MATGIDEKRLRKLLAAGKSQREIAGELGIPRTSLQKILKQLDELPAPKTPAAAPLVPAVSPPVVDAGTLSPVELEAVRSDFWEMIGWWRDRRLKQVHASRPRDTARQTYHVERRYIELIREEAEAEGVSITEVVNRALRVYFDLKKY